MRITWLVESVTEIRGRVKSVLEAANELARRGHQALDVDPDFAGAGSNLHRIG